MAAVPQTEPFGDAWAIAREVAEMVRPPERVTVTDHSRDFLIELPGGRTQFWDASLVPYLRRPMDLIASRRYRAVAFAGPARTGKTQGLVDCALSFIVRREPSDILLVLHSQQAARDYSKTRLDRALSVNPWYGGEMAPGKSADNVYDKTFKSGIVLTLGWPTVGNLSGKDRRFVLLPDYDRSKPDIDGQGSAFAMGSKRTETFLSAGMTVAESSPGYTVEDPTWQPRVLPSGELDPHEAPPTAGIFSIYNTGTRERWYWQCPHCHKWFVPDFPSAVWWPKDEDPNTAGDAAMYLCRHCGGMIEPAAKFALNRGGRWVADGQTIDKRGTVRGEAPRSDVASFWIQGPVAAYQPLARLVRSHLSAEAHYESTGSDTPLRETVFLDQGRAYVPKRLGNRRTAEQLQERAKPLAQGVVPRGGRFLVATVDVQGGLFSVLVCAYGRHFECWPIDRFEIKVSARLDDRGTNALVSPAGYFEDWDLIRSQVIERGYPLEGDPSREMLVRVTACDSGGEPGVTKHAYDFWRKLKREGLTNRFLLVKGATSHTAPRFRLTFPDAKGGGAKGGADAKGEIPLGLLNANMYKDQVLVSDLEREESGRGHVNFPDWLPPAFYAELTAETREPDGRWHNPNRRRNEALDLMVYSRAALTAIGAEKIDWEQIDAKYGYAMDWDKNTLVVPRGERPKIAPTGGTIVNPGVRA